MASNYLSSTETTNFARLCRLVVDISSDLLRDVLDAQIPPPGLSSFLTSQKHQLCQHLKPFQRLVIFPSGTTCVGTLQGLDFSLLYTLARTLQGINIPAHKKGWGKEPDTADRSISANIERLRFQRNEAYGHLPSASLPEPDFKSRWNLIRQSVLEIENAALSGNKYVRAVDDLLTMVMDPKAETNYTEELDKLRKEDLEVKGIIKDVKDDVATVNVALDEISTDTRDVKDDVAAVKVTLDEISTDTRLVKDDVAAVKVTLDEISIDTRDVKDDVATVKVTLDEISTDTRDVKAKQEVMTTNITATARDVTDLKARQEDMATTVTREIQHLQDIHPDLRPMIEQTKAMINHEKKEKKFYSTKSFCDAKEKLRQNKVVVIKGNTGDGKTAIAVQLLHELSQDQQAGQPLPLQIHNMEKLDLLSTKSKCITYIDDIFGEKDACKNDIDEWSKRLLNIKRLFANVEANNFLVITLRNEVFNSLEKGSRETIFTKSNIIDLSLDSYKVEEEKRALLNLYNPGTFSWTEKEIDTILTCAPNIGFPQCCQLFYNSPNLQTNRSRFFEKPFHFLNEALSKLPERSALLYLFLNDGFVRVKDLDPNGQNVNKKLLEEAFNINSTPEEDDSSKLSYKKKVTFVKESLKKLLGFLVMTGKHWRSGADVYRFHHDSIYVAVAVLYWKTTPVGYIQNCPSKYLSYLTTSKTATNMIVISSDHYTDMCERVLREFEREEWDKTRVGSLDVWKDPVFVERFVGLLNERKVDKLAVLNKACLSGAEECALYLLSEGVKPNKYTDFWPLVRSRHWNDGNKELCILRKIVVYMNDETKLDVLNEACESGAEECALYLLSEGVKPDIYTNLWSLVRRHRNDGNKQLCLLKEIVVYMNDETKPSVLYEACESGAEECALYLLSEGVKPDIYTNLWSLVDRHENDGNKQLCLLKEIVVYMNGETKLAVLNKACESGAEGCALYLLCDERVKPDKDTVLDVLEGGSIEVLRKLLEYDVTPTARFGDNNNVLHEACRLVRDEMVTLLCNTYPSLVHNTNDRGHTPLHVVAEEGNVGLFQTVERIVLNSLYRVENQQTKCESVDGCVVHKYCVCAQYMSQLVGNCGETVLHHSCGCNGDFWSGKVNREICLYLCRSYPGLTTIVDKLLGGHCLHYIAEYTTDVDLFIECETYIKLYVESTGGKYDVTTILTNDGDSVLDKSKVGAMFGIWESENNPLFEHLVKVFGI